VNREYFVSEQFIVDDLLEAMANVVEEVRKTWRTERKLDRYALSWPSETIIGDDKKHITHIVYMHLPDKLKSDEVNAALKRMVKRTKAYGIALIERKGDELRVLFETHHGARAWLMPLKRHGDILVPGETLVHDNTECLGLLWQAHRGTS
jgi:hypothetical protein